MFEKINEDTFVLLPLAILIVVGLFGVVASFTGGYYAGKVVVQDGKNSSEKEKEKEKDDKLPIPEPNEVYHPYDSWWTTYADVEVQEVRQEEMFTLVMYSTKNNELCALVLPKEVFVKKVDNNKIVKVSSKLIDKAMKKTMFKKRVGFGPPMAARENLKQIVACYKMV